MSLINAQVATKMEKDENNQETGNLVPMFESNYVYSLQNPVIPIDFEIEQLYTLNYPNVDCKETSITFETVTTV